MNILLTGANGFLGKHLIKKLARENNTVWIIVRTVTALSTLPDNVKVIEYDCSMELDKSLLPGKIDSIIHLAQSTQYRDFPDGMDDMVRVNILFMANLLEYARQAGCKHFIYTSTGSVYTDNQNSRENDCIEPYGAYPVTKYCAELLMKPYQELFNVLIFRPYFIYGAGQKGMLISNLISRISNHENVTIQGQEGGMVFCPTHVDDVVNVIMESLRKSIRGTYNVASPHPISIRDVSIEIGDCLGINPVFSYEKQINPPIFSPDLSLLSQWYDIDNGFRMFHSGIRETMNRLEK